MIRNVTMRIIDGIRYRPEDAPETIDPTPILQPEPEPEEVAEAEPQEDAEADLAKVAPSVAAAAKRRPKASKAK